MNIRRYAPITIAFVLGSCGSSTPSTPPTPTVTIDSDGNVQMGAPASGKGFQFVVPPFALTQGVETQRCFFFAVPGTADQDVLVNKFMIAQNDGSHHMNMFRVKTIVNLSGNPGDEVIDGECFKSANWADWPLVVNSQQSTKGTSIDWTLPDGVAQKFRGGELLMLQTHYVNAVTQKSTNQQGRVLVNFFTTTPDKAPNELGTAFATNQSIKICPGDVDKTFTTTCRFTRAPATIIAASGHFHSRGQKFTIAPWDGMSTDPSGPDFYTSMAWDEPPFLNNLSVAVPANGGVEYSCTFSAAADACGDPTKMCCFTFGPKVETSEHCNAFIYYYPKNPGTDVNCF
jgi:hypothetical protein